MQVLLLTRKEIEPLLSMKEVMQAVDVAFKEKGLGHVQMPPKMFLSFKKYNGDLRVMTSYLERLETSAVKAVNSHPDNPSKYGYPTVMAIIILFDPKNGAPLAI
ncbi:MAG: ornithine cyclodeaminase family protein, partial [Candidatus Bathyarchaeia archaeon]